MIQNRAKFSLRVSDSFSTIAHQHLLVIFLFVLKVSLPSNTAHILCWAIKHVEITPRVSTAYTSCTPTSSTLVPSVSLDRLSLSPLLRNTTWWGMRECEAHVDSSHDSISRKSLCPLRDIFTLNFYRFQKFKITQQKIEIRVQSRFYYFISSHLRKFTFLLTLIQNSNKK